MLRKRKPHGGGVKHFCKGVALSSFLSAALAGISFPSFAADESIEFDKIIDLVIDNDPSGSYGSEDKRYEFQTNNEGFVIVDKNTQINGVNKKVHPGEYIEDVNSLVGLVFDVKDGKTLEINGVANNSLHITGNGNIFINNKNVADSKLFHASGIYVDGYVQGHNLTISNTYESETEGRGIFAYDDKDNGINGVTVKLSGELNINSYSEGIATSEEASVNNRLDNNVTVLANSVSIISNNRNGIYNAGFTDIASAEGKLITNITVNAIDDINIVSKAGIKEGGDTYGAIRNRNKGKTSLFSEKGNIIVNALENYNGIYADVGEVELKAENGKVKIEAEKIALNAKGSEVTKNTTVYINADEIELFAGEQTIIDSNLREANTDFYNGLAVSSENGAKEYLDSNINTLHGAAFASGTDSEIIIAGDREGLTSSQSNAIYSSAVIPEAGDLHEDQNEGESSFKEKDVVSALYAEEGASITLKGTQNIIRTYANSADYNKTLERVVWAYNGKEGKATTINIDGYTLISTDSYEENHNNADIAIAAGTAVNLEEDDVNTPVDYEGRAEVLLTYADLVNTDGSIQHSSISGDILSAYDGLVNIEAADDNAGIKIKGNLLAGNNGILNVDLGNGGELTGRADDYQDADTGVENNKGTGEEGGYFNPAFSSSILASGDVNLTMGDSSKWNVTGQSWISSITTNSYGEYSEAIPEIDLTAYNSDNENVTTPEDGGQALTIGNITGDAVFTMNLDGNNVSNGNMLYMKQANGNYYINLTEVVAESEINNGHDGLRFATVGAGSDVTFSVGSANTGGTFNVEYEVGTDSYALNQENEMYNGTELNNSKPGDKTVDAIFGEGTTNRAAKISLLSSEDEGYSQTVDDETTNFKIIAVKDREVSDAGKTVIDMSRANYANAVYMDTLNKRQGEARFVGDTDHGVWVRLRHDNIGKDDSFRSHNTMVEVGFEQRDVNDYGEFHTGFALDYMNGSLDYHTVDGDGDIERYGVWFYTTYLGNDGQYADLVLKYGHLKNDFDINLSGTGVNVNGDYTNEVASISAEYGWKFSNSYNYYIEPQVQLQYSYVTGADYTTSYGTKVDLDSIHSLIGRVGFRAGKDFNTETPITAYIRGDVLHEFLGDQDIYAYDNTGVMDVTYENDDTWYSAGVGLSVQSSENTYFFIEGEQVFGADNDSTYTVSGGFKHSF